MNLCLASTVPQEVLLRIFASCGRGDNAQNARVCKTWKEAALDEVWRELVEWTRPLYQNRDNTNVHWTHDGAVKDLTRNLTREDWCSFIANSSRVRRIECFEMFGRFTDRAMLEIASTRPSIRLFPNISSLHASMDCPEFNPMIMHDSILDLCVVFPNHAIEVDRHLQRIEECMPNVTSLEIRLARIQPLSRMCSDDRLQHFFSKMSQLQKVTLPLYWLTPLLASYLSTCRGLREIAVNTQQSWNQHGLHTDMRPFQPSLRKGAFASLERLAFASTLPSASQFIVDPHFPSSTIKSLWLRVSSIEVFRSRSTSGLDEQVGPWARRGSLMSWWGLPSIAKTTLASYRAWQAGSSPRFVDSMSPTTRRAVSASMSRFEKPLIDAETPVQLASFLNTLAHSCHSLERLEIVITPLRDWNEEHNANIFAPIAFCHLLPILRLRSMKAFAIRHIRDLDVTDDQARSMALHWPDIEELTLNPHPALDSDTSRILTIRSLIHFAQHCPRLRSLSLSVKICQDSLLEPPSFDAPFKSLCLLNVGYSDWEDGYRKKLCRFLGRLLPADCRLETHATSEDLLDRETLDQPD